MERDGAMAKSRFSSVARGAESRLISGTWLMPESCAGSSIVEKWREPITPWHLNKGWALWGWEVSGVQDKILVWHFAIPAYLQMCRQELLRTLVLFAQVMSLENPTNMLYLCGRNVTIPGTATSPALPEILFPMVTNTCGSQARFWHMCSELLFIMFEKRHNHFFAILVQGSSPSPHYAIVGFQSYNFYKFASFKRKNYWFSDGVFFVVIHLFFFFSNSRIMPLFSGSFVY